MKWRNGAIQLGTNAKLALTSLRAHPGRTALTISGIVFGVFALVAMASALHALSTSIQEAQRQFGTGVFRIQREKRWADTTSESEQSRHKPVTAVELRALQANAQLVESVAGEMWSWNNRVSASFRQTEPVCALVGGTADFLEANALRLQAGRSVTEVDVLHHRPVAVIGAEVARVLFSDAEAALGEDITVRGQTFQVVGTLAPLAQSLGADTSRNALVLVPLSTFEEAFGSRSMFITLNARGGVELPRALEEARAILRWVRGVPRGEEDDFLITSNQEVAEMIQNLSLAVGAAAGGISLIALLIGGIGIMNIMLASVTQRTQEIGVRMALGARPGAIRLQFLTEAALLAVVGGLLGIAAAFLLVSAVGLVMGVPLSMSGWAIALGLAASTGTGLVAGSYPAIRAARMDPIRALRHE